MKTPLTAPDRLPPHSQQSEQGLLGCLLLDPKEIANLSPSLFYDLKHQTIFKVMAEMFGRAAVVNMFTVSEELKKSGKLEAVGGLSYLDSLESFAPSGLNAEYFAGECRDHSTRRAVIQAAATAIENAYSCGEVNQLVDDFQRAGMELSRDGGIKERTVKELVHAAIAQFEASLTSQGAILGVTTGYSDFDRMLNGLMPSNLIILAARPSVGKTSLAMNMAEKITCDHGLPVGVMSLEMSDIQLVKKIICSKAGVSLTTMNQGTPTPRDMDRIGIMAGKVANAPLYICEQGGMTLNQIRSLARKWKRENGVKLLVVDYLGLVQLDREMDTIAKIERVTAGLKALAKELEIPILLLCQINRDSEKEKRPPRLSDLRSCGAIEQDADMVIFLYRPEDKKTEHDHTSETTAIVAKNREGPCGDIPLVFMKAITRFEQAARVSQSDVPKPYNDD